jgi:hypothetical protein
VPPARRRPPSSAWRVPGVRSLEGIQLHRGLLRPAEEDEPSPEPDPRGARRIALRVGSSSGRPPGPPGTWRTPRPTWCGPPGPAAERARAADPGRAIGVFREVPEDLSGRWRASSGQLETRVAPAAGTEIRDLTLDVLNFARATGQDATGAARDIWAQLLNALNVPVRRSPAGSSTPCSTHASQRTGIEVDTLTRSVIEAGPAFGEMGFGLERSIALFQLSSRQWGRARRRSSSSLNMALTRMARAGATDAQAAFAELLERHRGPRRRSSRRWRSLRTPSARGSAGRWRRTFASGPLLGG